MEHEPKMLAKPANGISKPHVCVIGAGVAGLRCAEILLKNDIQVTILEARDRLGGRIVQNEELGFPIDMGPNWIHTFGPGHGPHPILELARKIGANLNLWHNENHFYETTGERISQERGDELMDMVQSIFDETFEFSSKNRDSIPVDQNVHDFVAAKVKEVAAKNKEDADFLMKFADTWSGYVGQSIKKQSLKYAYIDECAGEEQYFVEDTYKDILTEIAKLPVAKADIKLNHKVTSIKSTTDPTGQPRTITVRCQNSYSQTFDQVIVTIPLGFLKKHLSMFSPPLPPRLSQAITSIGVATFEKFIVAFPKAFWLSQAPSQLATTSSQQEIQEPNLKPISNPFTGFTEWLSPTYSPDLNPTSHQIEAWSLSSSSCPMTHRPAILFYTHGSLATHLLSTIDSLRISCSDLSCPAHSYTPSPSPATGKGNTTSFSSNPTKPKPQPPPCTTSQTYLSTFFHPYFSRLPHFSAQDSSCVPTHIVSTSWSNDELAGGGAFCNFPIGMTDAEGDVQALRDGVDFAADEHLDGGGGGEGEEQNAAGMMAKIWFAGEHVAPVGELGTVAGAWLSGGEVGGRVVERIRSGRVV